MYAKCGSLGDALKVFERMKQQDRDVVCWNALIMGYADNGQGKQALSLFSRMQAEDREQGGCCSPNAVTYVAAFKACIFLAADEQGTLIDGKIVKVSSLQTGMAIHSQAFRQQGCEFCSDIKLANTLVDMYAKCGSLKDAFRVFERMPFHSVVSWTILMLGCVENAEEELALELFSWMPPEQDGRAFLAALKACTVLSEKEEGKEVDGRLVKLRCLEKGWEIHSRAEVCGCFQADIFVGNVLVDLYAKCNSMVDARKAFDRMPEHDVVSWTALILGYAENGDSVLALELFSGMQRLGCLPNALTFVAVLKACDSLAMAEAGQQVSGGGVVKLETLEKCFSLHSRAAKMGYDSDILVINSLVSMYASCGSMVDAREVFERVPRPDAVLWTSLMLGYVENGEAQQALETFMHLKLQGFNPDTRTFAAALKACGSAASVDICKAIHADTCRYFDLEDDLVLATSLVDAYCKCGRMMDSQLVFDSLSSTGTDSVTFTALIAGYGRQGDTEAVFGLFDQMRRGRIELSGVTFLCLLTACSHAGLIEKGKELFGSMMSRYGIVPAVEHYVCLIDLLGRANELEAALAMVKTMPFRPNAMTWMVLLGACQKWKNAEVGKLAFESLQEFRDKDPSVYELMSNIYRSENC